MAGKDPRFRVVSGGAVAVLWLLLGFRAITPADAQSVFEKPSFDQSRNRKGAVFQVFSGVIGEPFPYARGSNQRSPTGSQSESSVNGSEHRVAPSNAGPKRIVAMGPNSAEVICALGGCDRIVGVSKFCVFPPELKKLPGVGGQFDPDLERIAALRPDLVITRGQSDSIRRLCEVLKVPVYDDETDSLPGVEKCVLDLGFRLRREDRAMAVVRTFREEIASIRKEVEQATRPRVFLTVARQPDRLANVLTAGKGTFLDEMIDIAGGVNVFGHLDARYPQVSPEAILAQQPEVIIELMPELEWSAEREASILAQWRQLGPLNAVTAGRVYVLTDENCLIPSPRFTAIIRKVAALLHPATPGRP